MRSKTRKPFDSFFPLSSSRLCGSYEAMEGGFTTDALIDMTGGIEEAFELNNAATAGSKDFQDQIKAVLLQAYYRQSMIGCSITVRRRSGVGKPVEFPRRFRPIRKSPKRVCRTVWSKVRSMFFFVFVEICSTLLVFRSRLFDHSRRHGDDGRRSTDVDPMFE